MKDLQKLHRLLERKVVEKMPEEAREPLLEAKKQMRLALRGFLKQALREAEACIEKHPVKSRGIKLE
ncbi:MAG: hypothetical protein A4E52_00933 [Pelotomaculum sp. PtaB.Bin013]|nr:MAG: hypothetical protein A4E52_00933 [Pelotomaculum sp. PtaB.Bin013]